MFSDIVSIIISPRGTEKKYPASVPATAMARYLTIYRILILPLPIPTAFITPISRNSPLIVKPIVKRSTTKAVNISTMLITIKIYAESIS